LIRPEEYLLLLRHQQQQQQPKEMCVYTGPAMVREEMTIWQGSGSVNISQTRGVAASARRNVRECAPL
jgi:hypothetical protein